MVSIFQAEISSLESQVAVLQARIATLSECEVEADGMLQVVQKTLGKVSALTPDALATLKSAVFALLNSGDNDDGSGNQPITPAPQPNLGGKPGLDGSSSPLTKPDFCLLEDCPVESLQGQSVEVACLLEDCPAESLLGQSVKIACLLGHHDILCEGEILEAPAGYKYQGHDKMMTPDGVRIANHLA